MFVLKFYMLKTLEATISIPWVERENVKEEMIPFSPILLPLNLFVSLIVKMLRILSPQMESLMGDEVGHVSFVLSRQHEKSSHPCFHLVPSHKSVRGNLAPYGNEKTKKLR